MIKTKLPSCNTQPVQPATIPANGHICAVKHDSAEASAGLTHEILSSKSCPSPKTSRWRCIVGACLRSLTGRFTVILAA